MTDSKSYGSANDDHVPQANQSDPNFYRTAQPLNYLNYLNVLGYVFNYILVFGTGNWFAKDLPDMNTVTIKYQVSDSNPNKLRIHFPFGSKAKTIQR